MSQSPENSAVVIDTTRSPHARLRSVPINHVTLTDSFWSPRLKINLAITIPSQFHQCEETGRLDNFRRVSGKVDKPYEGIYFNDSDIYKWLEAASWTLATDPDNAELQRMVDTAITEIEAAQQADGYLNTYFSLERAGERWTNLRDMHELYCAGHFFQAAVAHYRATGENRLLDCAERLADYICAYFGPAEQGKHPGAPGHEEIEMALVELYRVTGERRYLEQAQYFVDARGSHPSALVKQNDPQETGGTYHQDHVPFRALSEVIGHAVRMIYLDCGATDLCAETGDKALRDALNRQWANMTERRMYVTGGLGARHEGEAFGADYELPSDRAYAETCAAIANVMWNFRLLQLNGEAKYADLMELALYNGVLSGLSLDGTEYFYVNPLADDGTHRRQPWFGCACCPPNIARLLASLPGYFYSAGPWRGEVWAYIHMYASGSATLSSPEWRGHVLSLTQETNYPWDGIIKITITDAPAVNARILLRVPSWVESGATIQVNDEQPKPYVREDGDNGDFVPHQYGQVCRQWKAGDIIHLSLPMPVRTLAANPRVADTRNCVALMRGPLVYCIESADNPEIDVRDVIVRSDAVFSAQAQPNLLGGLTTLHFDGLVSDTSQWTSLYQPADSVPEPPSKSARITAIPYYAWANREAGPMRVWIPVDCSENG